MKRAAMCAGLVAALLIGGTTTGLPETVGQHPASHLAAAPGQDARDEGWREQHCRFATVDGRYGWTDKEVRRAIVCAVEQWGVPGGISGAVCIADKESGLDEKAANPSSSAGGVFQWIASSFDAAHSGHPELVQRWALSPSRFNARSNVVLAIRRAHDAWSWAAWTVRHLCGL